MKLQTKYNRATITATIMVLIAGSTVYYFFIRSALINQVDEALRVEEVEIYHHIKLHNALPAESHFRDQRIDFREVKAPEIRRFVNIRLINPEDNELENSRQLIFPVQVNDRHYTAVVTKSQAEAEHLLLVILGITIVVILLLVAILFVANRMLLNKICRRFYSTVL